jgi:hypothetical protein
MRCNIIGITYKQPLAYLPFRSLVPMVYLQAMATVFDQLRKPALNPTSEGQGGQRQNCCLGLLQ